MTGRYVEDRRGRIVKTKRIEGEIGARCLFVKLPLSLRRVSFEKGLGNGGETTEALGHCRTKWPAILSSWFGRFAWGRSRKSGERAQSDMGN